MKDRLDPTPLQRVVEAVAYRLANIRRLRQMVAVGLAVAGVGLLIIDAVDPHDASVVVAVHDLAPGAILTADDVELRALSDDAVPDGAVRDPAEVVGRALAGAARSGEVLTDVRTLGSRLAKLATHDPDSRIVGVRVADAAVAMLLQVGDRVDVISSDDLSGPRRLASNVAVVMAPSKDQVSSHEGPMVLLAVSSDTAIDVANASLAGRVTVTWS
ncbi:MAG: SAF domain-containing protein [Nocardiaceae bacterium]|nr:SAF domain-containing protein [Nocardiaceae bacterium]